MQHKLIITAFLILIYILYAIWFISKIKRIWLQKIINIAFTLIIIPICLTLIMPIFQKEQNEKKEHFRKTVINAIYEKKMDRSKLDELIENKYREIFDTSEKEAKKYTQDLLRSLDAKRKHLSELSAKSKELEDVYYARWKPFLKSLLTQFDAIISELINGGQRLEIENKIIDYKLVVDTAEEQARTTTIRKVRFGNGNIIRIEFEPAKIESGIFISRGRLMFHSIMLGGNGSFFQLFFEQKSTWLHSNDPRYSNFNGDRVYTRKNPMDDSTFCDQTLGIMKKFITNVLLLDKNKL